MGSLTVMTAAFWSGLTRKDAKSLRLQRDKEKLRASGPVKICMWETEGPGLSAATCHTALHWFGCVCGTALVLTWFSRLMSNITPCHFWEHWIKPSRNVCLQHHGLDLGVKKFFWLLLVLCLEILRCCVILGFVSFVIRENWHWEILACLLCWHKDQRPT